LSGHSSLLFRLIAGGVRQGTLDSRPVTLSAELLTGHYWKDIHTIYENSKILTITPDRKI